MEEFSQETFEALYGKAQHTRWDLKHARGNLEEFASAPRPEALSIVNEDIGNEITERETGMEEAVSELEGTYATRAEELVEYVRGQEVTIDITCFFDSDRDEYPYSVQIWSSQLRGYSTEMMGTRLGLYLDLAYIITQMEDNEPTVITDAVFSHNQEKEGLDWWGVGTFGYLLANTTKKDFGATAKFNDRYMGESCPEMMTADAGYITEEDFRDTVEGLKEFESKGSVTINWHTDF